VSFFVAQYRAEVVAPDPKCSNVMLIMAIASTSLCTRQNAVVSAEKVVTASLLQTGLGHHHGQSMGMGNAV